MNEHTAEKDALRRLARRWFGRCACTWAPASIFGLDLAERITNPSCPRHGSDRQGRSDEQVARALYRMNGLAWYGRDLGPWDDPTSTIGRNEFERERWLAQARALTHPIPPEGSAR